MRSLFVLAIAACCAAFQGGCSRRSSVQVSLPKTPVTAFDGAGDIAAYERARRSVDDAPIRYERYLAASEKAGRMRKRGQPRREAAAGVLQSLLSSWTNLGPANIAGMSRSLLIDPGNPAIMYTTGINGGVWKSVDGGATWNSTGDFLPVLVIGSLAMARQDSTVLYAGTGDGFISYDAVRGAGIFKSTDGAQTWTRLDSTANDSRFNFVNKIVVSPNAIDRVYAATNAGLLRSDDGGASWNLVLDRGVPQRGCHDLAVRTDQPTDVVLASCGIPGSRSNGALLNKLDPGDDGTLPATVFLNTDAATNNSAWNAVISDPNLGLTALAIAPSNQDIMYASASAAQGPFTAALLAIYRSMDGGVTWQTTVTNTDTNPLNRVLLGNPASSLCSGGGFAGQAWHDNAITVDPLDPMRVWVAGVDVFRSDDGGANWSIASYWWAGMASPLYSHADHHLLVFHPNYDGVLNQTLFDINDGGVFRTDNARAALSTSVCTPAGSIQWRLASANLATLQFYHGSIFPDGSGYFGGSQDNGTVLGTEALGPAQWKTLVGGDGGATAIDATNPNVMYASSTNSSLVKSTDGGRTFFYSTNGITESAANFFLIGTFVIDPNDSTRLWMGGNTIWRTIDGAANWTAASAPLVTRSFGAFAVGPGDGNLVLAGARTGEIFRSTNALSTDASSVWPMTKPRVGWVSSLVFDPVNPLNVYAVYSSFNRDDGDAHVYVSRDAGVSWTASDGAGDTGLPDAPFFTLVVNPDNPANLWVAGDLGLFVSMDGGASWAREVSGFPIVPTNHLTIQRDSQGLALYAFTHGRGLWRARIGNIGDL